MKKEALIRLALFVAYCHCTLGLRAQSVSGVINSYYQVTAVNIPANGLTVSNAAGLLPSTKVLIIQMKGASIDNSNTSAFGNITSIAEAGHYEYNMICGVVGNDVMLKYELTHPYSNSGSVQLIPVPQYNIVTISDTVKAAPWSAASGTGGVVLLEADTVYLNSAINVSGQGFAGGAFVNFPTPTYNCVWSTNVTNFFLPLAPADVNTSGAPKGEGVANFITNAEYARGKQANGGGGGNNHNTGGAGGANYGAGGNGGRRTNESFLSCHGANPGIGGASIASLAYSAANNRIFMGGGGGSGHQNNAKGMAGGNGGGIVIINANVLIGTGTSIKADGVFPVNLTNADPYTAEGDGGGGGGAGGSIILNVTEVIGNIAATATGGRGNDGSRATSDCLGPGGGGGGGVVWMSGATFSPNITSSLSGGANGVVSTLTTVTACHGSANGATPGGNGSELTGYVRPATGNFLCAPLPVAELKSFKARAEGSNISLEWIMTKIDDISMYEVEHSIDQVSYSAVARVANNGSYTFTVKDQGDYSGTIFYRLKIVRNNGTTAYSPIVHVTKNVNPLFNQVNIFPNPAIHQLTVSVLAKKAVSTQFSVFNVSGQKVYHQQLKLVAGYTTISVPVGQLAPGVYWLMLEANGISERKKFVKSN